MGLIRSPLSAMTSIICEVRPSLSSSLSLDPCGLLFAQLDLSRGRNNEGRAEVAVDDQVDQRVILANFVLLHINLPGQELVEIDLGTVRSLCSKIMYVKLLLKLISEAHDHVETVALEDLEDEKVCSVRRVSKRNRAAEHALVVQMLRVDQILDLATLVIRCHRQRRLEYFDEDVSFSALLILLIHEQLQLLLVVLEAANQVQLLRGVVLLELHRELRLELTRVEIRFNLDCLYDKLFAQRSDVVRHPGGRWQRDDIIVRPQHDNKLFFRLYGAVRQARGNEYFVRFALNHREKLRELFDESRETCHWNV